MAATPDAPPAGRLGGWLLPALAAGLVLLGGAIRLGCLGPDGLTAGEAALPWCYTDVVAIAQSRGLGPGVVPYVDVMTEYPPLTGLQWWVAGWLAGWAGGAGGSVGGFLAVTTVVQATAAAIAVRVLAGVPRRRLLLLAAAPTLVASATINWDVVPTALLAAGLVVGSPGAWRSTSSAAALPRPLGTDRAGRPAVDTALLAGVLLGLGGLAKLFPLLAVPVLARERWRDGDRRAAAVIPLSALAVVVAGQAAVALLAPSGWDAWLTLNRERPVDWDTLWYGWQVLTRTPLPAGLVNAIVAATVLLGWVWLWRVGRTASAPARCLALLGWLLLAGKVWSPQFTLWLLPLLALSRVPLGLCWAVIVADLVVVAVRFPFLAGLQGLRPAAPYEVFGAALIVRFVLLLAVLTLAVRERGDAPTPSGPHPPADDAGPPRSPRTDCTRRGVIRRTGG